jgi:peptide/nickel transport system substrate-binding protein
MKRSYLMILAILLLLPAFAFAGAAEEEVVDVEMATGETLFEGVLDIDRTADWELGRKGGRLVLGQLSDPKSFNGIIAEETSSTDVTDLLADNLANRNQNSLEWEPELAESWTISADQKTITYTLRSGLVWSDGNDLTAADFVFTANQVFLREDVSGSSRGVMIQNDEDGHLVMVEFTYIDSRHLSVTFPQVNAGIIEQSSFGPVPMHIWAPVIGWNQARDGFEYEYTVGTDEDGNEIIVEVKDPGVDYAAVNSFWGVDTEVSELVSCGPWLVGEYVPDERVVLVPNPNYWRTDANGVRLPYLDEMIYLTIPDQDTQLQRFIAGDLDAYGVRGEDYAVLVDRQEDLGFNIYSLGPAFGTVFITFNQNPIEGEDDAGISPPQLTWLSNKTFRQAMASLIDRETLINNVAYGFGYPQYSAIPTASPYYWEGAPDAAFPYDPQAAADMLDSIDYIDRDGDGWREDPDGTKISLHLATNAGNTTREATCELFQQEAAAVGIDIDYQPGDFNALVTQLVATYDWELICIGLTGSVDPISGANVYPSNGSLHMIEPNQVAPRRDWEAEVDAAWEEANYTTSEADRISGFEKLQRIWIEEVPWVYTFNVATLGAIGSEYGNYFAQPINDYNIFRQAEFIYVK